MFTRVEPANALEECADERHWEAKLQRVLLRPLQGTHKKPSSKGNVKTDTIVEARMA